MARMEIITGGGRRRRWPDEDKVRVYLACGATDIREGIEGLIGQAEKVLRQVPSSGAMFAFRGKRGDRLKILWWDGLGYLSHIIGRTAHLPIHRLGELLPWHYRLT